MKTFLKRIIRKAYHEVNDEKAERFYKINGFDMDLGEGHKLSLIMKYHPMYDRFVPYLGTLAENVSWGGINVIVDIGANVGDTVAGLIRNTKCEVICVEPTKKFYSLLSKNVDGFGSEYSQRVHLVNAYISVNSVESFVSKMVAGTAIMEKTVEEAEAPTYTLPDMLKLNGRSLKEVSLIKIDTDGYDSDCICSMGDELKDASPVLYWENQIDTDEQRDKFLSMVDYLNFMGYKKFFVFDNFGNYLCCIDGNAMKDVNMYLGRILHGTSTRSFYYVDILSAKEKQVRMCQDIITKYVAAYQ